jgi:hypothetical protein
MVDLKNLLPLLARLIESGKISIRLGPVADVKDWLNNYQAFEKSPVDTIDAVSVRLVGADLQIDCGLDDYAAQVRMPESKGRGLRTIAQQLFRFRKRA